MDPTEWKAFPDDKQEPSETDYAARTGLFLGSEGRWEMGGHRRGGWGETDYLCLVPSAKLHLPMLSWTSFQEMSQPERFNIYNVCV